MHVFCDFDRTISVEDATDSILARFAHPRWQEIEEQWRQGAIGSAVCMQRQVSLIRASRHQLDTALDAIEIDASFPSFAAFCRSRRIPLTIVSDGVDYFIHRILARHRLPPLRVIAHQLVMIGLNGHPRYHLTSRSREATCDSATGVCKCRRVGTATGVRVYIGDGRSDFCVANKPEVLFAKRELADFCRRQGIAFTPYRQFSDVAHALTTRASARLGRPAATPSRVVAKSFETRH